MIAKRKPYDVRALVSMGVLSAIAYVVMVVGRIPISTVAFLKYDPKDLVIAIGGFIFGPLPALMITAVVSLVEMFTVSDTGPIGLTMNILSTAMFSCTASYLYKRMRTQKGAVVGLVAGVLLSTGVMLLWNYLITPLYMTGTTREQIAAMLIPIFLPFNLLKGSINAAIALLVYKPAVRALRSASLLPESTGSGRRGRSAVGVSLAAGLVLITCVLLILAWKGIL